MNRSPFLILLPVLFVMLALLAGSAAPGARAAPDISTGLWDNYGPGTTNFPGSDVITTIAHDALGGPWLGTGSAGIATFNGVAWSRHTTADGLPSNNVRDIMTSGTAAWVATSNGIGYYDGTTWTSVPGTPLNTRAIAYRGGNAFTYLIATNEGLRECGLLFPLAFSCTPYTTSNSDLPHNQVWDVATTSNDVRWVVTNAGVARITGSNSWTVFTNANTPGCSVIEDVSEIAVDEANGRVWFGSPSTGQIDPLPGEGACMLETNSNTWHHFHEGNSGLTTNSVTDIAVDADGRAWFSTWPNGTGAPGGAYVCTWIDDQCYWAHYTRENSNLPWNRLTAVGAGPERVWFGTRRDSTDVSRAGSLALYWQDLGGGDVYALDYLTDDIWAATNNGIRRNDGAGWTTALAGVTGRSLLALAPDDVWAGTIGDGAWHWDGGWRQFNSANSGLAGDNVRAIARDQQGRLWFGTWADGASVYDPASNAWTTFDTSNALPADSVQAAFVDSAGQVWLGTEQGVARYDGVSWTTFTTADGLPDNRVRALAEDGVGQMWAGTPEGAATWDGSAWTAIVDPLPHTTVRALHLGADGLFWLGTARGAVSFDGDDYTVYRARGSGLLNERLRAITSDEEGALYFGAAGFTGGGRTINGGVFYRRPLGAPLGSPTPLISGFDPPAAEQGEIVTVSGSRFSAGDRVQFRRRGFNSWEFASTTYVNENTLQARVPSAAVRGPLRVVGDGGVSTSASDFDPLPVINSINPSAGLPGSPVTIYGTNLDSLNPPTEVQFGDSEWSSLIVVNRNENDFEYNRQWVVVPEDATTGPVRLRTASGVAESDEIFTVAEGQLTLMDYEVHQGLPGMPLVAGKSTVVRLYLGTSNPAGVCAYATRAAVQLLDPQDNLNVFFANQDNGGVPAGGEFCNTVTDPIDYSAAGSINVVIPGEFIVPGVHFLGVTVNNGWVTLINEDLGAIGATETGHARLFAAVPDWDNASDDELALFDRQMANMARAMPVRDGAGSMGSGGGVEYVVRDQIVCDGLHDIPGCELGDRWDFWQEEPGGQEQACILINNLNDGRDDGDAMTFEFDNVKDGDNRNRFFLARLHEGQTWPADLQDLMDVTVSPSDITLDGTNATLQMAGGGMVNCGPAMPGDIVALSFTVTNNTGDDSDIAVSVDYDESIITAYGAGAVLLDDGAGGFQTRLIPGVFFAASGWGGNKYTTPVDENYNGVIDEEDLSYSVAQIEVWDPLSNRFFASTNLDNANPGDLVRMFVDQNENGRWDNPEPKALDWLRTENANAVLYGMAEELMNAYNDSPNRPRNAEYPALLLFQRINPFMGPGQESGGRFWADIDEATTIGHEWGHAMDLVDDDSINSDGSLHSTNDRISYVSAGFDFINVEPVLGDDLLSMMFGNVRDPVERGFYEPVEYLDLFYHFWDRAAEQVLTLQQPAGAPHFSISGVLYDDDRIVVRRSLISENLGATAPDSESDYVLRIRGGGQTLVEAGIPVSFLTHDHVDPDIVVDTGSSPFSIVQPFPAGASAAEIWHGSNRLWRGEVSQNAPVVQVLTPEGGDSYGANAQMTVSWTGSDADGDDLTYAVRYSPDGGASWRVLAAQSTQTSLTVSLARQPGTTRGIVEVEASDGFYTGAGRSDGFFSVGQKDPLWAAIHGPVDGAELVQGQPVRLDGSGYDLEDGALSGDALSWSSDQDGSLGSGGVLSATLSVGPHTLTLQAMDSQGGSVPGTVSVMVLPDFDGDGLSDDYEQQYGVLSWWNGGDAAIDSDGDGLVNRAEAAWGTHPNRSDTDGDGVPDGEEAGGGSDPTDAESVPVDPELVPGRASLIFSVAAGTAGVLQQPFLLLSSAPPRIAWTASESAPWLELDTLSGRTPSVLTVTVDPSSLGPGRHTAQMTFSSDAGNVTVPIHVDLPGSRLYLPLVQKR